MKQNWTNGLILGPLLAHLAQIWAPNFLLQVLPDIVPSYHPMQFKWKLTYQTWENGKKTNFRQDFVLFHLILAHLAPNFFWKVLPLLVVRHCSKLSSYAI